jgi:hypothetical protein
MENAAIKKAIRIERKTTSRWSCRTRRRRNAPLRRIAHRRENCGSPGPQGRDHFDHTRPTRREYAVTIGLASCDIAEGEHVHSHNVEDITNRLCNEYERAFRAEKG